jgi:hypothetical protein
MEFDASKVRTEWSNELDGKKGWFSDSINDDIECCLRIYVESNNKSMYGTCTKGNAICPFKGNRQASWKYFYPDEVVPEEDVIEFYKKNLFIAGYNDNLTHIGDTGYTGDSVSECVSKLTECWTQHILTGCSEKGFIIDDGISQHQFFYRTKCAPKDKYVPWTKETAPDLIGKKIISKDYPDISSLIIEQKPAGIYAGIEQIEYYWLFNHYTMDDGSLCGHKVQDN